MYRSESYDGEDYYETPRQLLEIVWVCFLPSERERDGRTDRQRDFSVIVSLYQNHAGRTVRFLRNS